MEQESNSIVVVPQDGTIVTPKVEPTSVTKTYDEEYVKSLREEAAANRVKAKELAEAIAKREEEEAKKRGEFEQLFTTASAKVAELQSEVDVLREFKSKADALHEERRQALIAQLPSDVQVKAKDASVDIIELMLSTIKASGTSQGTPKKTATNASDAGVTTTTPVPKVGQAGWLTDFLNTA